MSLSAGAATPSCALSPRDHDAVLFDLDGVLTRTAGVHAAAWKRLFDEFLERRSADTGEPFVPFDIDANYRSHVDGKPRYAGVVAFLGSRGIGLPQGAQDDGPNVQSVRALGNLKDKYFLEHLEQRGVEPYEAATALVRALLQQQVKTAVVSSGNNCAKVLETTGIAHLFDEFLHFYGAEMILEIAHFWSSIAIFSDERGRYEIRGVVGPDEFHDGYPNSATPGLNNNAYTNMMAVWVMCRALGVLDLLSDMSRAELTTQLGLSVAEFTRWGDISRRMFLPIHEDGIISQFEGYEALRELDWQHYRARYGNIQRLDLILEAENDSPNRYKLSKQADVLMLFYLLSAEELRELFERLGYPFKYETIPKNVTYYSARSSHGSTLCRVVHAWVLARSDQPRSMIFFAEALQSDVADIQQGTTSGKVHLGAMAGSVDLVERVSTGIEVKGDVLRLNPELPQENDRLDMRIRYRGHSLDLQLTRDALTVRGRDREVAPILLSVEGEVCEFVGGTTRQFPLFAETTTCVAGLVESS